MRTTGLHLTLLLCGTVAAAACSSDLSAAHDPAEPTPVVLDYSPTFSDAGALLYLAESPDVDLLAVTLAGTGESACDPGGVNTHALLAVAGTSTVPVGCGPDTPLVGDRRWPEEFIGDLSTWVGTVLPETDDRPVTNAVDLLVSTLERAERPVTLVVTGPVTNIGILLRDHPATAERIASVVVMGGAVDVAGNVEDAPSAEWNLYIDPEAMRLLLASGVPVVLVPLDATNDVPWTDALRRRLGTVPTDEARAYRRIVGTRPSLDFLYLWDELAAVAAVHPELLTFEERTLTVDDDGATRESPDGNPVRVAVAADSEAFETELLTALNGGPLPELAPLTAAERQYFDALAEAAAAADATIESSHVDESAPAAEIALAVGQSFVSAASDLVIALRTITPPSPLEDAHAGYLRAVETIVAAGESLEVAISTSDDDDVFAILDGAMRDVGIDLEAVNAPCQVIEDESVLRGGPEVCPG